MVPGRRPPRPRDRNLGEARPDRPQIARADGGPMDARIRGWWSQRQGLDGSLEGASAHDVLVRAGWMRTVGGAGPYLGLFARAGLSRSAVDQAIASGEICELPSARGCTYLVPRADYAVALAAGEG